MSGHCMACRHDKEDGCEVRAKDWPYANHCKQYAPFVKDNPPPVNHNNNWSQGNYYNNTYIHGEFEEFHPVHKDKSMRYALLP